MRPRPPSVRSEGLESRGTRAGCIEQLYGFSDGLSECERSGFSRLSMFPFSKLWSPLQRCPRSFTRSVYRSVSSKRSSMCQCASPAHTSDTCYKTSPAVPLSPFWVVVWYCLYSFVVWSTIRLASRTQVDNDRRGQLRELGRHESRHIKPQVDRFVLPSVQRAVVLASGRLLNFRLRHWPSFLLDVVSFTKQVLAQIC